MEWCLWLEKYYKRAHVWPIVGQFRSAKTNRKEMTFHDRIFKGRWKLPKQEKWMCWSDAAAFPCGSAAIWALSPSPHVFGTTVWHCIHGEAQNWQGGKISLGSLSPSWAWSQPCHPVQSTECHIQLFLGLYHLSEQPIPVPGNPFHNKFFLMLNLHPLWVTAPWCLTPPCRGMSASLALRPSNSVGILRIRISLEGCVCNGAMSLKKENPDLFICLFVGLTIFPKPNENQHENNKSLSLSVV